MKKNNIVLIIVLIVIGVSIFYLDSAKVSPVLPKQVEVSDDSGLELAGIAGYINTNNITIAENKGKVVLIDFWTYTCINCIRTLPFLTDWDEKYRDKGLVIIGVHTPEFEFEKEYDNVLAATKKYDIKYPVVQDNEYATWSVFKNRYWPHKFLLDKDGVVRYDHIGEGGYAETERQIQELLAELGEDTSNIVIEEDNAKTIKLTTPELYLGYDFALPRGQNIGNFGGLQPEKIVDYVVPDTIVRNKVYLSGKWRSNADGVEAVDSAAFVLGYAAKEVNIVADSKVPIEIGVLLNNRFITEEFAGDDVMFKNDQAIITIDEPFLYNVVRSRHGQYVLQVNVPAGFSFNAFTFG